VNAPHSARAPAELARLRAALGGTLGGARAHARMQPRVVGMDTMVPPERRAPNADTREAAVLLGFVERAGGLSLLFIRRPDYDGVHAGQIAFPGGRRETGEPLERTALRETEEELGIAPARIEMLGPLSPLFVWVSNHLVQPYVGIVRGDAPLRPCAREVADVLCVPLARVLDARHRGAELVTLKRGRAWAPYFALPGARLWGASAMMLAELVDLIEGVREN
jgi:8-oxo-dGTP pyrophosphatase MutT (NUDIX family)